MNSFTASHVGGNEWDHVTDSAVAIIALIMMAQIIVFIVAIILNVER